MFVESGGREAIETESGHPVSLAALERRIGEGAARINAETSRWLELIAEFDRRGGHEEAGFSCCSAWLAWRCSLAPRAAREHVRVARRLTELPRTREAFATGALSYSKVRVLTRAAEPEMEEELLEMAALATASQLERMLRGFRQAIDTAAERRARERRYLSLRWEPDGTLSFSGNLPTEEGAVLVEALELARDGLRERGREGEKEGEPSTSGEAEEAQPAASEQPDRADALMALAETALAGGIEEVRGGDRQQLVVHVDVDTLAQERGPEATGSSLPMLEGVGALPRSVVERLGCDASIVALYERAGEPLSVGRKTRTIPPAIGRALRARDQGCRFPGCERTRFVDAHHIEHWAHGGETSLDNLVQLCRHHHRLIHEGRFTVERGVGELVFRRSGGRVIAQVPELPRVEVDEPDRSSAQVDEFEAGEVGAEGAGDTGSGESFDLDLTVSLLARVAERRGIVPTLH